MSGPILADLSSAGDVVTCQIEEPVMYSAATGWACGRRAWTVIRDARKGRDHLVASGTLPPEFAAVRDRCMANQKGDSDADHLFEVPIALAAALTGFRLDVPLNAIAVDMGGGETAFTYGEPYREGEEPFEVQVPRDDVVRSRRQR